MKPDQLFGAFLYKLYKPEEYSSVDVNEITLVLA